MGWTTKGKKANRRTYRILEKLDNEMEDFIEDENWDKTDVINRSAMYYIHKARKGELDDPKAPPGWRGEDSGGDDLI